MKFLSKLFKFMFTPLLIISCMLTLSSVGLAGIADKTYYSPSMNINIAIKVYTPPGYETSQTRYPVVYNLHGGGGSPQLQWERTGATIKDAIENNKVRPMIYVYANGLGDTLWVNTYDGTKKVEKTVIEELIPFIDSNYRTIASKSGRAIDGFSMGGFGCLNYAFEYPDMFSSVVSYGAALLTWSTMNAGNKSRNFGNSESYFNVNNPRYWARTNTDKIRDTVKVRMVCGTDDTDFYQPNVDFKNLLTGLGIPVNWVPVSGVGHCTQCLYEKRGLESLKFIEAGFNTTPVNYLINEDCSNLNNFTPVKGGTWSPTSGRCVLTNAATSGSANNNLLVHNTSIDGDFNLTLQMSADASTTSWDDAFVAINYQDSNNYYAISFNESNNTTTNGIQEVKDGVSKELSDFSSTTSASSTLHSIKIERKGTEIKVYRNGTLLKTFTGLTRTTGKIGFGTFNNNAKFDNLKVWK